MKFNKVVTIVVLALSFCAFDQMKDSLVEWVNITPVDHNVFLSTVDKISELVPENLASEGIIRLDWDGMDKDNGLISMDWGKKVFKTILFSEF